MNLKVRLAVLYSLSVFVILVASAVSIYILNENFRKEEFLKRLLIEATESFRIFSNQQQINDEVKSELTFNAQNSLQRQSIYILNSGMRVIYASNPNKKLNVDGKKLGLAKIQTHIDYEVDKDEFVVLYSRIADKSFYTIVSAYDVFGRRKSDNLKLLLGFSVLGGFLLSGLIAFFYVKQAMNPLEKLKEQIESITDTNLKQRIDIPKNDNEVWQIAKNFNAMLDRLEQAFEQRKNFVQHASHELRTPLATMMSQTESAINKTLTPDGYKKVLHSLKEDQQNLIDLTNSLLTLSKYETITHIKDYSLIRIDEVLYQTAEFINQLWPTAVISINFETVPDNEELLVFRGNESLIRSAIQNLLKNAIQYSNDNKVTVYIDSDDRGIKLKFDNYGKQLTEEEQGNLFVPFFRGENSVYKKGYGLGLAIVGRIIKVHNGTLKYEAVEDNINRFMIWLPRGTAV